MAYARLTPVELRLADLLLASGAFAELPACVERGDLPRDGAMGAPFSRRFPQLRERLPALRALAAPLGRIAAQGSIADLLRLRAAPAARDQRGRS